MKIGDIVRQILRDRPAVEAAVGPRIYPIRAPQKAAFPCIAYTVPMVTPSQHKMAPALSDLVEVDILCWGKDYDALMGLAWEVRMAVDSFSGTVGDDKVSGAHFVDMQTVADDEAETIAVAVKMRLRIEWGG